MRAEVSRSAGEGINIRALGRRELLEIRDLAEWTTKEEVTAAVRTCTGDTADSAKVVNLRKMYGRSQVALVLVTFEGAKKIMASRRLRVGMVSCRVRRSETKVRCFRRLAYGHVSKSCTGPDRRDCCRKCGESGHKAASCGASNGGGESVRGANRARQYILDGGPARRDGHRIVQMIKILQINVDGGRVAQDLTEAKSKELGIDVLVVCEQYRNGTEENGWIRDGRGKSTIAVLSQFQ